MKRALSLKREPLTELTSTDLGSVVGGVSGMTCPPVECMSGGVCTLTAQPRCWAP